MNDILQRYIPSITYRNYVASLILSLMYVHYCTGPLCAEYSITLEKICTPDFWAYRTHKADPPIKGYVL